MFESIKIQQIKLHYQTLSQKLNQIDSLSRDEIASLSKEFANLEPIVKQIYLCEDIANQLISAKELQQDSDPEIRDFADNEVYLLNNSYEQAVTQLQFMLLPKDSDDQKDAIIEIRAGTGGEEASLFAHDLMKMYMCYAVLHNWKSKVIDIKYTDLDGIKEAIIEVSGQNVFARLKFESGVHRVQRVPVTEASGRIHTSAATVAILPKAEEIDVDIQEKDLRIDVYRSSGAGGQHVNTTDSAVRITHLPTGIVVTQQDEKSQHKNKAKALSILYSRIYAFKRKKYEEERAQERSSKIGSGDRSERIRTYNFPQSRVTDHRINFVLYELDNILNGSKLDILIEKLIADHQSQLLAQGKDNLSGS